MNEITIDVLDKGFVTLVDHLGTDLTMVNSARVSFGNKKDALDKSDRGLINYLVKNKHDSPMRHVQLQFRLKAPEFVMRQWYKHVIGMGYSVHREPDHAWNEISGRYVEYDAEFYHPKAFRKQSTDNKQATVDECVDDPMGARMAYNTAIHTAYGLYKELLKMGVGKEQARGVLPVSFYTEVIWTCSLQGVLNFISLRDHEHAQWEIREYAKAVRALVAHVAPVTMEAWDQHRG